MKMRRCKWLIAEILDYVQILKIKWYRIGCLYGLRSIDYARIMLGLWRWKRAPGKILHRIIIILPASTIHVHPFFTRHHCPSLLRCLSCAYIKVDYLHCLFVLIRISSNLQSRPAFSILPLQNTLCPTLFTSSRQTPESSLLAMVTASTIVST